MTDRNERTWTVLDAPSNLGLRPPGAGTVPGCYKMPWALRNFGVVERLGARDGGCVVPPRYDPTWRSPRETRNAKSIAGYSVELADRVAAYIHRSRKVIVLGGDCSILIGIGLALRRVGRFGLAFFDGHSDFRHLGNSDALQAAAGEDLAIVTGRGDPRLVSLEGLTPYINDEDVHLVGVRDNDPHLDEIRALPMGIATANQLHGAPAAACAAAVRKTVRRDTQGYRVHVDLDVVDEAEMPAADCPEPNGPDFRTVGSLLEVLANDAACVGVDFTIYDLRSTIYDLR